MSSLEQYRLFLQSGDFLDCGKPEVSAPSFELVRLIVRAGSCTKCLGAFYHDSSQRIEEEGEEWKSIEFRNTPSRYAGLPLTAVIVFVDNGPFDFSQPRRPRKILWSEINALGLRPMSDDEQVLVVGYLLVLIKELRNAGVPRSQSLLLNRNLIYFDHIQPESVDRGDFEGNPDEIQSRHYIFPYTPLIEHIDHCPFTSSGYCGYLFVKK